MDIFFLVLSEVLGSKFDYLRSTPVVAQNKKHKKDTNVIYSVTILNIEGVT